MFQVKAVINTSEPTPKKPFGMRLFRSKNTTSEKNRKGSLDSNVVSTHSAAGQDDSKDRRSSVGKLLKRKPRSVDLSISPVSPVQTQSQIPSPGPTKLKKQQGADFPVVDISQAYARDKQTGEQVIDHTDLLHSLGHQESRDSVPRIAQFTKSSGVEITGEQLLSKLPARIWQNTFTSLSLADKASLSLSSKAFRRYLISAEAELDLPGNESERKDFLLRLDSSFPEHLFCFACNVYHRRLNPRKESLRPTNVANPVFTCPYASNLDKRISRVRVTSGRTLPFTLVQLALRTHNYSASHGIDVDTLSKRYRDRDNEWYHQTRYAVINNHLLMRVTSTSFAAPGLPPSGIRNLLYNSQEEFHPYFSTCPHWRDGDLMPTVKCALSHIPKPIEGSGIDRVGKEFKARFNHQSSIVSLCGNCRPMRRCPDCPTEYLIEVKMAEDKHETDPTKLFKQALVVTRWSDLGDGSTPTGSREWAACTGELEGYDSFEVLGKRAINGIFEAHFNPEQIPPQNILNMNPTGEKLGEAGHDWF